MNDSGVGLRHPNKRFQIKQTDKEERVAGLFEEHLDS